MLFNSLVFPIFLVIVFGLYWLIPARRIKLQNLLLLVASYVFYGWWDWRFLGLIVASSVVDYIAGIKIHTSSKSSTRTRFLILSLAMNLGALGLFKYFNFFIDSFAALLTSVGMQPNLPSLQVILPVGISFYTFQTLSYTIDIYRKKLEPIHEPVAFFAFVSFFPQLVAGPIERAKSLLPQFLKQRQFDLPAAKDGLRQMLWGYFKKVVIADNLAVHVDQFFGNYQAYSGVELAIGVTLFAFQIYCDFSGYSDIALGTARLFGFKLMRNFAYPYFSRDIGEFWRRWHISLSSWFRDYVYIPLGGSYVPRFQRILNIFITFTVSGFWHGANWTFVIWGFLNGLYYIPLMLAEKHKEHTDVIAENSRFPSPLEWLQALVTFALATFAWIFFRAESVTHAISYIGHIFTSFTPIDVHSLIPLAYCVAVVLAEWPQRRRQHGLEIAHLPVVMRWSVYSLVMFVILTFGNFGRNEFIYFQF